MPQPVTNAPTFVGACTLCRARLLPVWVTYADEQACDILWRSSCRYLSVQSVVWPQTGTAAATVAVAPLLNWLLVFKLGFGLDGAAAATVLSYAVETLLLLGVVIVRDRRLAGTEQQTWHGWCVSLSSICHCCAGPLHTAVRCTANVAATQCHHNVIQSTSIS